MDRVLALMLLVVLSPVLAVVAVLVKLSLGSPVLLRQKRVGRNGQVFELHKFRTMHADRRQGEVAVVMEFDGSDRRARTSTPTIPASRSLGERCGNGALTSSRSCSTY